MAMKVAMGVALAMVIAFSIVSTVTAQAICDADIPCANETLCCSAYEYCGEGPDYCGNGCLNGPCINDTSSGVLGDIFTKDLTVIADGESCKDPPHSCPNPLDCCSQYDYCGTGPDYCGPGCKWGHCINDTSSGVLGDIFTKDLTVIADGESCKDPPHSCPNPLDCCSQYDYCGTGPDYCGPGCQWGNCYNKTSPPSDRVLGDILTKDLYEQFFPNHLSFYKYEQLIEASKLFPQFGTTGDSDTRKREIAAYAAHVTHETSGLKEIVEDTNDDYCDANQEKEFPCNGKHFNGRGPLQLSWNYNYDRCGNYLKLDLLSNPDLVAENSIVSFKSSLWFWNVYGDSRIPRIHDVITGNWKPSQANNDANRLPGFGVTINIINGGLECSHPSNQAKARVKYFKEFCKQLNISPGDNLDCKKMKPFYDDKLVAES